MLFLRPLSNSDPMSESMNGKRRRVLQKLGKNIQLKSMYVVNLTKILLGQSPKTPPLEPALMVSRKRPPTKWVDLSLKYTKRHKTYGWLAYKIWVSDTGANVWVKKLTCQSYNNGNFGITVLIHCTCMCSMSKSAIHRCYLTKC